MRALILWAEPASTNLGVRTLARGTERLLDSCFPGIEVSLQGNGAGDAPVRIGDPRRLAKRLVHRRDELVDWVRQFDLVVDTRAGDSFADIYGLRRLTTMTLMDEVVHRAKVPLVMGPQTIGPFGSRRGKLLARRTLATSKVVFARDRASRDAAAALGRPVDALTTDVVFALDAPPAVDRHRDVIVNPSGLLWDANPHVDSEAYRAVVTELCQQLLKQGRRVSLLAHVLDGPLADNDTAAVTGLAAALDAGVETLMPTDLDDVRAMLASAELVVGSRMHACLNALSVGTPAIPLAYSRKFEPLLDGIGWRRTVDLRANVPHVDDVLRLSEEPTLGQAVHDVHAKAGSLIQDAREVLERAF